MLDQGVTEKDESPKATKILDCEMQEAGEINVRVGTIGDRSVTLPPISPERSCALFQIITSSGGACLYSPTSNIPPCSH